MFNNRVVKMINTILFFILFSVTRSICHTVYSTHHMMKEDLELERQLKLINKSPIKSIQTKSGYIVDCVDINKQPAFDHPLLKNHKLQRKPSFESETGAKILPTKSMFELEKVRCPKETVPIRRITKNDLIYGKSLFNKHSLIQTGTTSHSAYVYVNNTVGPYYGVSGTTSVYNPAVRYDQSSEGYLYVQNGEADRINKIIIGWHVSPQLYNSNGTYIYSRWTSDHFKDTGCYNMICHGFIQTNKYYFGSPAPKTSTYGGNMVEMPVSIFQDRSSKNWWVEVAGITVGYFPAALFTNLDVATEVGWGGRTVTPAGTASPPMGSEHFPDDIFVHAAYFRHVAYRNESRINYGPEEYFTTPFNDASIKCFEVAFYGDQQGEVGYSLQFGGPGGGDCEK